VCWFQQNPSELLRCIILHSKSSQFIKKKVAVFCIAAIVRIAAMRHQFWAACFFSRQKIRRALFKQFFVRMKLYVKIPTS
jgi:hypothetical protein